MAISVGIPMMFLDRQNHYGAKPNSKHGNAKAIIDEALPNEEGERKCRDMDFNPARTQNNRYLTSEKMTSEELLDRWNNMCDSYKVTVKTKNGIKERSLRADADIGFAMIVKPSGNEWGDTTIGDQHRFLADSVEAIEQVCKKYKVKIDVAYEHRDEKNMHAHIFGHDDSFKLSKKIGLAFMNDLNHGLYVDLMKAKGWKIEPKMSNYVEDTQGMNEEELAEYKEHRKAGRKEHGKSSKQYKSDKDIEKAEQEAGKIVQEANQKLQSAEELMREAERIKKLYEMKFKEQEQREQNEQKAKENGNDLKSRLWDRMNR